MHFLLEVAALISAFIIMIYSFAQAWLAITYHRAKMHVATAKMKPAGWVGELPRVLLQLPIYNERYVVERLLHCMAAMDYPKDKLHIQLLDDSTDETSEMAASVISELKSKGTSIDHVRRVDRRGFKAGALQYGLSLDDSEFIAIFDADFLPRPDFVRSVIQYFGDAKVGMVQTRWEHLNANYSMITKLMAWGIDNHFSVEQGGRQASHSFINFNGTGGMWRRETIDDAGGWESDCLTEDLDLSFRSQIKGWKFLFVEDITTPSELPVEMSAVRSQQFRWTKGAAETGKKTLISLWQSHAGLVAKLVGSAHMLNSVVFSFVLLMGICLAAMPFFGNFSTSWAFWCLKVMLPLAMLGLFITYGVSQRSGGFSDSTRNPLLIVSMTLFFSSMATGLSFQNTWGVVQGLLGKATPFVRTPKLNIVKRGDGIATKRAYSIKSIPAVLFFEMVGALIFAAMAVYSLRNISGSFFEVYVYFAFGFGMVSYLTLREVFAQSSH